jgi:hypothetical protein
MNHAALPKLIDVLTEVIGSCRAHACLAGLSATSRARLLDAADNVQFFLERRAYRRATEEAWTAAAALRIADHDLGRLPSER